MFEDVLNQYEAEEIEPAALPKISPSRRHLSNEDQLYLWCLALQRGIAGKVAPVQAKGHGSKAESVYGLLINDANAVALVNQASDLEPISVDNLKAIVKRFRRLNPPYRSSN